MLHKILEVTLVNPILARKFTISCRLPCAPLPKIFFFLTRFPSPLSVSFPISPLPLILLPIIPFHEAFPMLPSPQKLAFVYSVFLQLSSFQNFSFLPDSLQDPTLGYQNPFSCSLFAIIVKLSEVEKLLTWALIVFPDEVWLLLEQEDVDELCKGHIGVDRFVDFGNSRELYSVGLILLPFGSIVMLLHFFVNVKGISSFISAIFFPIIVVQKHFFILFLRFSIDHLFRGLKGCFKMNEFSHFFIQKFPLASSPLFLSIFLQLPHSCFCILFSIFVHFALNPQVSFILITACWWYGSGVLKRGIFFKMLCHSSLFFDQIQLSIDFDLLVKSPAFIIKLFLSHQ